MSWPNPGDATSDPSYPLRMRILRIGLGLVVLGAFSVACSSSSPGDTGMDSGIAGSGHGDGASGSEGASSGPAGLVSFAQGGGPDLDAFTIIALFDETSGKSGGGTSPCGATVDGCTYCSSSADAGIKPGTLMIQTLGAGVVTFKDGSKTLATLPYSGGDAGGDYEIDSNSHPSLAWAAGDTLEATASGGAIPAFSASITAPDAITGVSPAVSLTAPVMASLSAPFVISWTPPTDDGSTTVVLGSESVTHPGTIGCKAADSAGKVSVPASLISQLLGGAAGSAVIGITRTVTKPVSVTGAMVSIQASPPSVGGSVTFM
jgi:hypothetical protein